MCVAVLAYLGADVVPLLAKNALVQVCDVTICLARCDTFFAADLTVLRAKRNCLPPTDLATFSVVVDTPILMGNKW